MQEKKDRYVLLERKDRNVCKHIAINSDTFMVRWTCFATCKSVHHQFTIHCINSLVEVEPSLKLKNGSVNILCSYIQGVSLVDQIVVE